MSDENQELIDCFIEECKDNLLSIKTTFDSFDIQHVTKKDMDILFRAVHTIKGGSGMFNFEELRSFAHELENLLSDYRQRTTESDISISQDEFDYIKFQIESIEEMILKINKVEEVKTESPEKNLKKDPVVNEVLRVPLNKVNSLLDNIWEVFLIRNQLAYLVEQNRENFEKNNLAFIQSFEALDTILKRNINEIESKTMSMRMNSVSSVFQRMRKAVDDYVAKTGKKIILKTEGENIELDKKIIDMLADPLIHLVRNAIDHGIESDHLQRKKLGKGEVGTVTLIAGLDGNNAFIQVKDDGKGIDPKNILAAAQRKGLNTSNVKNDTDAINLIFEPGFSTSSEVTDVSGRGVGMDAVKNSIEAVSGKVEIKTEIGKGTSFIINIPTGVSIVQALEIKINNYIYAFDSGRIFAVKNSTKGSIKSNGNALYFFHDEKYIRVVPVGEYFFGTQSQHFDSHSVCVVQYNGESYALLVDQILQTSTLVTKPLPPNSAKHDFMSSVSLLQSGQPIFILSTDKIIHHFLKTEDNGYELAS